MQRYHSQVHVSSGSQEATFNNLNILLHLLGEEENLELMLLKLSSLSTMMKIQQNIQKRGSKFNCQLQNSKKL